jgi:predicted metalloendopeptidase
MSSTTKRRALEKLATLDVQIGYPDTWLDYSSVRVDRGRYWETVLAARRWNVARNRDSIDKPVDRGRWPLTPASSEASYNTRLNQMTFPAGILQPPAFALDAVDAVNYGAIGVVIGHGFDDFIAWGQFRGDAIRPETQRLMVQGDPHPIGKYRVIGPLSNMPEFEAAFSCKAGTAMVRPPAERCAVW